MRNFPLFLAVVGAAALFVLVVSSTASAQTPPPQTGDWVIEDETNIEGQDITLLGDLIVRNGGVLHLRNSTLTIASIFPVPHSILVRGSGEFHPTGSTITGLTSMGYHFEAEGPIHMVDCDISKVYGGGIILDSPDAAIVGGSVHNNQGEINLQGATWGTGIYIHGGNARLEGVEVHANSIGIGARGDARLVAEDILVHDNQLNGMVLTENSTTLIANSTIRDNRIDGIELIESSTIEIRSSDVLSNSDSGIFFSGQSKGYIHDSSFSENINNGILLGATNGGQTSQVRVRGTSVIDNGREGIGAYAGTLLEVKDCFISENLYGGIIFADRSSGYVNSTTLSRNYANGIAIGDFSKASIRNALIEKNEDHGVATGSFSGVHYPEVLLEDSVLKDNDGDGVASVSFSKVTVINNSFSGNQRGIQSQVKEPGILVARGNTILDSIDYGIVMTQWCESHLQENIVRRTGKDGIAIANAASPTLINNTISDSGRYGLSIRDISKPLLYNTSISESGNYDVWIGDGSKPFFVGTALDDSMVFFNDTVSVLSVGWWVRFQVQDNNSVPVGGASYWINASDNSKVYEGVTHLTGRSRTFIIVERELTLNGARYLTPHTFAAAKENGWAEITKSITASGFVTITLSELSAATIVDYILDFELPVDRPVRDFVRGRLTLRIESGAGITYVEFFLKGTDQRIGRDDTAPFELDWDTGEVANGIYTIEAVGHDALGRAVSRSEFQLSVFNSQSDPVAVAAAVGLSSLASAGAAALLFRGSGGISGGASGAVSQAGDFASEYGEELLYRRTAGVSQKFSRGPGEIGVVLVTALGLGAAFAYVLGVPSDFSEYLAVLPSVLMGAALVIIAMELVEAIACRALGITSRFSLWGIGLIALLASAFLFRAPFGSPGKTMVDEDAVPARPSGAVALMKLMVPFILIIPFLLLLDMGYFMLATAGITTGLMLAAYDAVPFRPMEGRRVAGWSPGLAAGILFAAFGIMWCWQAALLPIIWYYLVGAAGVVCFIAAARAASGQNRDLEI